MADLFEASSRLSLRFETPQGSLSTEDLWKLPLTSTRANVANLDDIAITLNKKLQDSGVVSFVKKVTKTNEILSLKLEIVKHVIDVLQSEADAHESAVAKFEEKQKLLGFIANKKDEALAGKTVEELQAMVASL